MLASRPVLDHELELLEDYCPSGEALVGVLHAVQPGLGSVVSDDGERLSIQIVFKELQSPYHSQTLFLDGRVATFPWLQLAAAIGNGVFFSIITNLAEYSSQSNIRGISMDNEGLVHFRNFQDRRLN